MSRLIVAVLAGLSWFAQSAAIQISVTSDTRPVPEVQVIVAGKTSRTDANGRLTLQAAPGPIEITVVKEGFNPVTVTTTVAAGQSSPLEIALERQARIEEHVTVASTRTDKRIDSIRETSRSSRIAMTSRAFSRRTTST